MTEQLADLLTTFTCQSNKQLSEYFYDNSGKIDSLIQLYSAFNRQTTQLQIKRIQELRWAIQTITNDRNWTAPDGLELQCILYNTALTPIILEGGFESTKGNPLGKFVIRITTKTIQAWNYYEDQLMKDYPSIEPIIADDTTTLEVNTIWGNDIPEIMESLMSVYTYLQGLTNHNVMF
ncbi:hypothetical protein SAMN05518672_1011043 [Chitinophaga sp. CF118]|uniref:hypothetical protein n=1 Tax=Chitinophaga sp. CF118 TaxID=1884367 RepID=UPI0008EFCCF4|nr:hypothetical protein [Chitinophaga sp. CF118]SFD20685.1 hypothetical protein SAMN05518672_1011043 [Chitinophaga sp. CF118]